MEIGVRLGVGIAGIPHRPDYSMKKVSCVLPQKALLPLVIAKVPMEKHRDSEHLDEHTKDLTTSWYAKLFGGRGTRVEKLDMFREG